MQQISTNFNYLQMIPPYHLIYPSNNLYQGADRQNSNRSNDAIKSPNIHPVPLPSHGLGICIDLLTIKQPWRTKSSTTGWNSKAVP